MADIEKERERFEAFMRDKWPEAPLDGVCSVRAWEAWQAAKSEAPADVRELVEVLERIEGASMSMFADRSHMIESLQEIASAALAKHKGQT